MSKATKDWARHQAARLQKFLKAKGIELPRKECQEAVAAMQGANNWQTFEASPDADIVIHDPNALLPIADTVLQATLFKQLPEGRTIHSICEDIAALEASWEQGASLTEQKARLDALGEGVKERKFFNLPVGMLPGAIEEARIAIVQALLNELLKRPATQTAQQEIYRQMLRDWRLGEGNDKEVPVTDRRAYEARVEVSPSSCEVRCAYPHKDAQSLEEGAPQIAARLEIREGLPCVGLYSDIHFGEELAAVFGARKGELVIRVNGVDTRVPVRPALQAKLGENLLVLKDPAHENHARGELTGNRRLLKDSTKD